MKNVSFLTNVTHLTKLVLFVCASLLFLTGCDEIKKGAASLTSADASADETKTSGAENVLVVALDQSASVAYTDADKAANEKWLKKFLYHELEPSTDIVVMYIGDYSQSASVVNHRKIEWKVPDVSESSTFKTDAERKLEESDREEREEVQMKEQQKKLLTLLSESSSGTKSNSSAVLEVLPQIAEQIKTYKHCKILFLSDLCQFSSLRDFEKSPPVNWEQANEMANTDHLKLVKEYPVMKGAFTKVQRIEVLIPKNTPKDRTVMIPKYWNALFQRHLGYQYEVLWSMP
ncbi:MULTISPECIES: hypothetical protein [unclassified Chryseobacterium]|uniref:hypothetical protein n=1 Tax=unclassified Chryseobacterium TaxID=2593645 RepID=UPI000D3C7407|nr:MULTISPECIES: hypothetical protein [unclassified Chryseobacterium]MCQ4142262.1 hypothetical protein [Chryseobacterium sp. EO14]PTT75250.1 hypothetical protein DBR25_08830 [Chryseobacterium sp. HMWF001]PVV50774.1 hypothetical protein DD829_21460 [Chryseobacterium sp. HMWF035]